jgi:hypothetical protein
MKFSNGSEKRSTSGVINSVAIISQSKYGVISDIRFMELSFPIHNSLDESVILELLVNIIFNNNYRVQTIRLIFINILISLLLSSVT